MRKVHILRQVIISVNFSPKLNSGVACNTIGNPSVFLENFPNWKTQYLTVSAPSVSATKPTELKNQFKNPPPNTN